MDYFAAAEDHRPLFWFRGRPMYATHVIVIAFVISMLATVILQETPLAGALGLLIFHSTAVLHGQVWRVFTYGFLNEPSLWFAIDMVLFFWFGREVERFFGRKLFLILYASVYLLPPLVLTVFGLRWPYELAGETGSFALFIAFATLYPDAMMLLNITAQWGAWILVGIYSLMALSAHDIPHLITLWVTSAFAWAFVRYQRGAFSLPSFSWPKKTSVRRETEALRPTSTSSAPIPGNMAEIDALLDKIAQSGIHSLTPKERARLDAARNDLRRKN